MVLGASVGVGAGEWEGGRGVGEGDLGAEHLEVGDGAGLVAILHVLQLALQQLGVLLLHLDLLAGEQHGVEADADLHQLMIGLGGHCIETLVEAFDAAQDDIPTMFIAYTVKGFGLPLQGHKDNHAGLMTPSQVEVLRQSVGVPAGQEWEPLGGLSTAEAKEVRAFIDADG